MNLSVRRPSVCRSIWLTLYLLWSKINRLVKNNNYVQSPSSPIERPFSSHCLIDRWQLGVGCWYTNFCTLVRECVCVFFQSADVFWWLKPAIPTVNINAMLIPSYFLSLTLRWSIWWRGNEDHKFRVLDLKLTMLLIGWMADINLNHFTSMTDDRIKFNPLLTWQVNYKKIFRLGESNYRSYGGINYSIKQK